MRSVRIGASRRDVVRLFDGESVAGLGEGELLDRFATRRDEAAFEALVDRLGPMVLGVCRRMLADPLDVEDAFQATFLILVRKAGSIRDRDLVGPWLYGVALKVARRARLESARRKSRERFAVVPEAVEESAEVDPGWPEVRALIDEEIGRLSEPHRRAVVLCDVEGLSREEAALRLGWTLNMVRGRLERARGRLRDRLARRGVAPTGAWSALMVAPPTVSPALLAGTVRASLAFSVGRMGAGLASTSAVALSRGVLRMMMLSKLKVGLAVLLSAGFVAGGSGLIAAQGPGDKPGQEAAKKAADPAKATLELYRAQTPAALFPEAAPGPAGAFQPRSAADLARARIEAALRRYEAQLAFYLEGRITTDRLINASRGLMQAHLDAATAKASRVEAVRVHYDRLKEMLKREQAELEVGRATEADLTEIKSSLLEAEFTLAKELETPEAKPAAQAPPSPAPDPNARAAGMIDTSSLSKDRVAMARKRWESQRGLYVNARTEVDRVLDASQTLMEAELDALDRPAQRPSVIRAQLDRIRELETIAKAKVEAARADKAEVEEVQTHRLDAEFRLAKEVERLAASAKDAAPTPAGPGPSPDVAAILAERAELARTLLAEAARLFPSEITTPEFLAATRTALAAELDVATTPAGRQAAIQAQVDRLRPALQAVELPLSRGEKRPSDAFRVRLALLDAELALAREKEAASGRR